LGVLDKNQKKMSHSLQCLENTAEPAKESALMRPGEAGKSRRKGRSQTLASLGPSARGGAHPALSLKKGNKAPELVNRLCLTCPTCRKAASRKLTSKGWESSPRTYQTTSDLSWLCAGGGASRLPRGPGNVSATLMKRTLWVKYRESKSCGPASKCGASSV